MASAATSLPLSSEMLSGLSSSQQNSEAQFQEEKIQKAFLNHTQTESEPIEPPSIQSKVSPLTSSSTDHSGDASPSLSVESEQTETTLTPFSSPAQNGEFQKVETPVPFQIGNVRMQEEEEEEEEEEVVVVATEKSSHLQSLEPSDSGYSADSPEQEPVPTPQFSAPSRVQSDAVSSTVPLSTSDSIPTSSTGGLSQQTPSDKTSLLPETQVNGVPPSTSPQIGASTPRSMLPKMPSKTPEEPSDWKKIAAIVTLIITGVIAAFAVLCVMKIFPPAFLGGQIGTCCTLAASGLFVIGSGILLWVRLRSKPVENA